MLGTCSCIWVLVKLYAHIAYHISAQAIHNINAWTL